MPQRLPLIPSVPAYQFGTTLDGIQYLFNIRWNTREEAWYMDILKEDETPIRHGIKVTLGSFLGRRSVNPDFPPGVLMAYDTSQENRDAGFDDLGTRVVVFFYTLDEFREFLG